MSNSKNFGILATSLS